MLPGHQKLNVHTKFRKCVLYTWYLRPVSRGCIFPDIYCEKRKLSKFHKLFQSLHYWLCTYFICCEKSAETLVYRHCNCVFIVDFEQVFTQCLVFHNVFVVYFETYFARWYTALYLLSSLKTNESACTLSQNLYVSQHTKTGTLYDFATMATIADPALDMTLPLARSACAPNSTHVT